RGAPEELLRGSRVVEVAVTLDRDDAPRAQDPERGKRTERVRGDGDLGETRAAPVAAAVLLDTFEAIGHVDDRHFSSAVPEQEASHLPVAEVGRKKDAPPSRGQAALHRGEVLDPRDRRSRRCAAALGPIEEIDPVAAVVLRYSARKGADGRRR